MFSDSFQTKWKYVPGRLLGALFLLLVSSIIAGRGEACGGNFTDVVGNITSPSYPNPYPNNVKCVYLISRPQGHRISLTFTDFKLEPRQRYVCHDYVKVQDGASDGSPTIGGPFCGPILPEIQSGTQNLMRITFVTDSSLTGTGFRASYTSDVLPDWSLLVTATNISSFVTGLYRLYPDMPSLIGTPVLTMATPQVIGINPISGRVYWADYKTIRSTFLSGNNVTTQYTFGQGLISGCNGLAVDYLSGLIIFADVKNVIGLFTLSFLYIRIIVSTNLDSPKNIALDMMNGVAYWTEVGSSPKIARANYDGSNHTVVISAVRRPTSLTLDQMGGYLYWADAYAGKIERSDLDGNQRTVLYSLPESQSYAITFYDNSLYVVETTSSWPRIPPLSQTLYKINATTGVLMGNLSFPNLKINNMLAFAPKSTIHGPNGCGTNNGGCPYICVPTPGNLSACLCPDNMFCSTNGSDIQGCGGNFTSLSGVIPSPKQPRGYPKDLDCIYYIRLPEGNRISVSVLNFSLGYLRSCSSVFLEIRDGDQPTSPVLGNRFCGYRVFPSVLSATQNNVRIRFKTDSFATGARFLISYTAVPTGRSYTTSAVNLVPTSFAVGSVTINGPHILDTNGSQSMTLNCQSDDAMNVAAYNWSVTCVTQEQTTCIFTPAVPEDDGKVVTCTVYFQNGQSANGNFTLDLNYPPKFRPIISGYKPGDILKEGQSLNLSCSVLGGKPTVTSVFLACGGYADNPDDVTSSGGKESSLEMSQLQASDNGAMCVCTARWKNTDWYTRTTAFVLRVEGHFSGLQTDSAPVSQHVQASSASKSPDVGWAVGGVFITIIAVTVVVIAIVIFKRRQAKRNGSVSLVADFRQTYSHLEETASESDSETHARWASQTKP